MAHIHISRRLAAFIILCVVALASLSAAAPDVTQTKPGTRVGARPQGTQSPRRQPAKTTAVPVRAPKIERPVPFAAGETLSYDISWSMGYLTAGTATLRVIDKHPSYGSLAYYIVGEGSPTPMLAKLYALYYKADSLLDAYTLTSQRGSVYSNENGRTRMKSLRFNPDGRTALFEMQTSTNMKKDIAVPAQSQDALSALFALRAMPLAPGTTIKMPVCISDVVYYMSATVGARESVKTGLGTQSALRITPMVTDAAGKSVSRPLSLWLSDDAKKVPLRLQADLAVGSFNLVLREAKF
ncbi:MAG: DUF3108 domain-containing protein [Acidobacteria bacterium]|nr:DUF3108 domain-containing protein [Acidobacteriota bacterium]